MKLLTIVSNEKYTAYRQEVSQQQTTTTTVINGALALDGGVGGVAF